jgi:myo-inositol 2-dehydrogenase/D-chiro-inositol 1-dehydrogenase
VAKAEAAGAVVQVGFQRRFDPAYVEAKRLLDSGELGTLYMVRLIAHDHTPPPDAYIPVSGGLFRDSSIHDFDALRWLTGSEVVEVYATGAVRNFPIFAAHDDVDTGACIFTCANGVIGSHAQTRHNPLGYDVRMEVIGSKDAVCVGVDGRTPIRSLEAGAPVMANPAWDSFLDRFETAYRLELLEFLKVARGEIPSPCTARDAMQAMRIAVAATKSRLEHRPVRLDEVP